MSNRDPNDERVSDETGVYHDEEPGDSVYDAEPATPEFGTYTAPGEAVHDDEGGMDAYDEEYDDESDESTLFGLGIGTLLVVAGIVLFLFPEPATSTLGLVLMVAGVVAWAAGALL